MMRFILLFLITAHSITKCLSQSNYWQQELSYNIQATLDTKKQQLHCQMQLTYINHSPDTLGFIWFHLWANAYQNFSSPLYSQLQNDNSFESKYNKNRMGGYSHLNFTINNQPVAITENASSSEILKLPLPTPLYPGDSILISTPFEITLPNYFSRMGYSNDQYMICQWYPKPAVYDRFGWHAFPYLERGEFYGEFGSFHVNITLPKEYIVAATGEMNNTEELNTYKQLGSENRNRNANFLFYKANSTITSATKTLSFYADKVHDFAWFASKNYIIQYDSLSLPSGRTVDIFSYFTSSRKSAWQISTQMIKSALNAYSTWVGEYPYPTAQVVQGPPKEESAGMEYPMVTLISEHGFDIEFLDGVIAHELGHNWFYGILGSNEREHPWMDEGMNTFFQLRYEAMKYEKYTYFNLEKTGEFKAQSPVDYQNSLEKEFASFKNKTPIDSRTEIFLNKDEYFSVSYYKTAYWLLLVENKMGRDAFEKGIRSYFETWKFKHPYPEDFKNTLEASSGINLDDVFKLLGK